MTADEAAELAAVAAGLEFVFAKTMPEIPHWYAKRTEANPDAFEALRAAIRRHGVRGYWKGRANRYLALPDGFKYWLTFPVINRDRQPIQLTRDPVPPEES